MERIERYNVTLKDSPSRSIVNTVNETKGSLLSDVSIDWMIKPRQRSDSKTVRVDECKNSDLKYVTTTCRFSAEWL